LLLIELSPFYPTLLEAPRQKALTGPAFGGKILLHLSAEASFNIKDSNQRLKKRRFCSGKKPFELQLNRLFTHLLTKGI